MSAGKGDRPRHDLKKYGTNHDAIDWGHPKKSRVEWRGPKGACYPWLICSCGAETANFELIDNMTCPHCTPKTQLP